MEVIKLTDIHGAHVFVDTVELTRMYMEADFHLFGMSIGQINWLRHDWMKRFPSRFPYEIPKGDTDDN